MSIKEIVERISAPHAHWVGDGFPVRSLFSYGMHSALMSPFLLFDYAGPAEFTPALQPRGVGQHPHRGFETVTIVYQGEVAHRDSTGQGGVIGPGDVQWMTAGAGIIHEEFHSPDFTRQGGTLEMVQLWVNLPARDKMTPAGYQAILNNDIPSVSLPEQAGTVRVIAGELDGHTGPAQTFTPMNVWDIRLNPDQATTFNLCEGWPATLVVLHGTVLVNGQMRVGQAETLAFDRSGNKITLIASKQAILLLLSGEPIDEPVVGHGPFVMNTRQEIIQAIEDYNSGHFGTLGNSRTPS